MNPFLYNPYQSAQYAEIPTFIYPQYSVFPNFDVFQQQDNNYYVSFRVQKNEPVDREQAVLQEIIVKKQQEVIGRTTQTLATRGSFKIKSRKSKEIQEKPSSSQYTPQQTRYKKGKYGNFNKYLKKNTESNLSNQIFTYMSSRNKSGLIISKIISKLNLKQNQILNPYYQYMRIIRTQKKKYLNKKFIGSLCKVNQTSEIGEVIRSKYPLQQLSLLHFSKINYILASFYLNNVCNVSIVRSKKMDKQTRLDHLQRRRKIFKYIKQIYNKI